MNLKKILIPVESSSHSTLPMELGRLLAAEHGGQLCLLHVHQPPRVYAGGGYVDMPETDVRDLEAVFEPLKILDEKVPIETKVLIGDPATEIVELAEKEGADLIIVGSHGRSGLTRLVLGSVAEAVVRQAHCPVLVCKPKRVDQQFGGLR